MSPSKAMRSLPPCITLLLWALATLASAETGGGDIVLVCPQPEWFMYQDRFEMSCLKLMPQPRLFDEAFRACDAEKSRLLSLLHKRSKIHFVNDLILNSTQGNLTPNTTTMWFFDPLDAHQELVRESPGSREKQPAEAARWLVINPNADKSKIELLVNRTAVPRNFICEAPVRPAAQRAQFEREPEDVIISDELLKDQGKRPPFVVTFNCQAYGIPKPTVRWVLTSDFSDSRSLIVESINATVIHEQRLPLSESDNGIAFFDLQRDCRSQPCPADSIQERSQLIIVNPQLLDIGKKRIACLASNNFGTVLSREAQIFAAKMGDFVNQTETVTVKIGAPDVVPNLISTEPDAASAECFRVMAPAAPAGAPRAPPPSEGPPANLIPLEEVNRLTLGAIQMSKATFDLIIDAAGPGDAGQYVCEVRMHNGRVGHVSRKRTIRLEVKPCAKGDASCDTAVKPVAVVPGYPTVLSMNFLSNRVIRTGDDFLLECPCTGKRHPQEELQVEWNLNNRSDISAKAMGSLPRGSKLLIQAADSLTHTGLYHCRCHRGGAETSAWSSVRVVVLPATTPTNRRDLVRVKTGQTVSLNCHVPGGQSPAVSILAVQPLRGAKPLEEAIAAADAKRFKVTERTGSNQFGLTISEVVETDSDVYGCRVLASYAGKLIDYNTYYTTLVVDKLESPPAK